MAASVCFLCLLCMCVQYFGSFCVFKEFKILLGREKKLYVTSLPNKWLNPRRLKQSTDSSDKPLIIFLSSLPRCLSSREDDKRVLSLHVDKDAHSLYVAFSSCVIRIPLSRCERHSSCHKYVMQNLVSSFFTLQFCFSANAIKGMITASPYVWWLMFNKSQMIMGHFPEWLNPVF